MYCDLRQHNIDVDARVRACVRACVFAQQRGIVYLFATQEIAWLCLVRAFSQEPLSENVLLRFYYRASHNHSHVLSILI